MGGIELTHRGLAVLVMIGGIILLIVMPEMLIPLIPLELLAGCELLMPMDRPPPGEQMRARNGHGKR